jgi:hypothetical protein
MDSLTVGINKLSLQPGDVVVFTVPDDPNTLWHFGDILPDGVEMLVLPASVGISILRNGQPVAPEVEAPIEVEVR